SSEESDTYHASRPRGSQIGAWASDQSHILKDRKALEQKAAALEAQYEGKPIPRPPHWGGYRITPLLIEFWQERPYRLHDRIVYRRYSDKEDWIQERLYP
ncbi:MAG: pyridoxal 5'-phosphate synthase, partial [Alphaproteobacteria bacterium]